MITAVDYPIILGLYTLGYFFIISFSGPRRALRSLAGAFPMGCCLWGASTLLTASLPLLPKDGYGFNLAATISITTLIAIFSFIISLNYNKLSRGSVLCFGIGFILLAASYWLFLQLNISIFTGDSLSHIHPQEGMATMRNARGFNSTLAALAGFAGQDRYFFPFHPIFTLSLLLLMGECIFHEVKSAAENVRTALCAAIVGPLLLSSCFMTAVNAFFVNNHILVALLIIFALSLLLESNRQETEKTSSLVSLGVVCVSFLNLLRLEGLFVAMVLLLVMLGGQGVNPSYRLRGFLLLAALTFPFQIFMIINNSGKVNALHLILLLIASLLLPVFFTLKRPYWVHRLQDQADKLVFAGIVGGIILFCLTNYQRISIRFGKVLHNTLDESYWGFLPQTLLVTTLALFALRFLFREEHKVKLRRHADVLLYFFIAGVLLIIFMLNFHGSRLGWSDSQNRMLMHFLPVWIVWASIETGLGLAGRRGGAPTADGLPACCAPIGENTDRRTLAKKSQPTQADQDRRVSIPLSNRPGETKAPS